MFAKKRTGGAAASGKNKQAEPAFPAAQCHACCPAQLGNNTDSCQPCNSSKAGEASTIDDEAASIDMPLEDIVHIEDVSRTTTVARILEVVSRRLGQLGYKGLSLKMAIVIPPVLDH